MFVAHPVLTANSLFRRLPALVAVVACISLTGSTPPRGESNSATGRSMAVAPRIILWTWERPDDLRFVDPQRMGISFLAGTIRLEADDAILRPRLNTVRFPPGAFLMACVRIEPDRVKKPRLSSPQRGQAVAIISRLAELPGVKALQVDFDAIVSEREFYAALLSDLRTKVPASIPISMTALASWCLGGNWISDLPVDEAVPMLFHMGADRATVVNYLGGGGDFSPAVCRKSLGLSTDEPLSNLPEGRRIYLFHNGPWTAESARHAVARVQGVR